jgi:hypothetical protein
MSASVITPIVFWASLVPRASATVVKPVREIEGGRGDDD